MLVGGLSWWNWLVTTLARRPSSTSCTCSATACLWRARVRER
jgi:hypothetical protein